MKKIIFPLLLLFCFSCKKENIESKITNKKEHVNQQSGTDTASIVKSVKFLTSLEKEIITEFSKFEKKQELSDTFSKLFYKKISENTETLIYDFNALKEQTNIKVATSTDKKFRVYSWDNNSGGTMRFFNQIVQFTSTNGTITHLNLNSDDSQAFISKIYSLQNEKNETIYFQISNTISSTKDVGQSIDAYKIDTSELIPTDVFNTGKKQTNYIRVDYDFFSVVDRPERPVELITLKDGILNIALVNEEGKVTAKNLVYEWNGNNFDYKGVK